MSPVIAYDAPSPWFVALQNGVAGLVAMSIMGAVLWLLWHGVKTIFKRKFKGYRVPDEKLTALRALFASRLHECSKTSEDAELWRGAILLLDEVCFHREIVRVIELEPRPTMGSGVNPNPPSTPKPDFQPVGQIQP